MRNVALRWPEVTAVGYAVESVGVLCASIFANLNHQCFENAWSAESFQKFLALPTCFAHLATTNVQTDAIPVGFILCQCAAGTADVLTFGVVPGHRRKGIGSQLLSAAVAQAAQMGIEDIHLEVAEDNAAARKCYERLWFREIGRRINYYRTPKGMLDAVILSRHLR